MAPVDNGLTETVQHQVSHSAGPQNAATVLRTVPVQPAATSSQLWRGDPSTIWSARAAVVQPGRCDETIVNSVENEPACRGPDAASRGASRGSRCCGGC